METTTETTITLEQLQERLQTAEAEYAAAQARTPELIAETERLATAGRNLTDYLNTLVRRIGEEFVKLEASTVEAFSGDAGTLPKTDVLRKLRDDRSLVQRLLQRIEWRRKRFDLLARIAEQETAQAKSIVISCQSAILEHQGREAMAAGMAAAGVLEVDLQDTIWMRLKRQGAETFLAADRGLAQLRERLADLDRRPPKIDE